MNQSPANLSRVFAADSMTFVQELPSPVDTRRQLLNSSESTATLPAENDECRNSLPTPESTAIDREQIVISPESVRSLPVNTAKDNTNLTHLYIGCMGIPRLVSELVSRDRAD